MEESKFNEYYKAVQERDREELENMPIPTPKETSPWIVFGLSLGIASIVFSFFTQYDIFIGILALVLSIVGYCKKRDTMGLAAIICSSMGIATAIAFAVIRYGLLQVLQ